MKTISILGCGWLGYPLAKSLVEAGWRVKGSTTSAEKLESLRNDQIDPYLIQLGSIQEEDELNSFLKSEYLLINVPPSKGLNELASYKSLIEALWKSPVQKVVFISSTSVYPNMQKEVDETSTEDMLNEAHPLLAIERLFQKQNVFQTTILRFGGLIGGSRHPGGFFRSGRILSSPDAPVNLIHLDDCIYLISEILNQEVWGQVFNGVADTHPTKREFYSLSAEKAGFPVPAFGSDSKLEYKIVKNERIKSMLGLSLKRGDLMKVFDPIQ